MFGKKKETRESACLEAAPRPQVKFARPKILLVDMPDDVAGVLSKEGYNLGVGSFGRPYKVKTGSDYQPVIVRPSLPNYTEQEIVIVDLVPKSPVDGPSGEKDSPMEELDWWAKCSDGVIDPRPRTMAMVQKQLDRVLENGGMFIIFADTRDRKQIVYARLNRDYHQLSIEQELPYDNWSFLSVLASVNVTPDHGVEINPVSVDFSLVRLLSSHLDQASFCCTLDPGWGIKERWGTLAKSKYGSTVAACIAPPEKSKSGWVFIFPRLHNKASFLADFLKVILPSLAPALFPHVEGQRWVHRREYELPTVIEMGRQISEIQDAAAAEVSALKEKIEHEQNESRYLYDLLRETGRPLVLAVLKALNLLGFKSVIDVDEEMKAANNDAALREDLRIHDRSPILVVDVKGVGGHPSDPEALQAQKHAFIYIQEHNRVDVRGLTIINHQRHLPPLDRDNDMPFRKEILDNAAQVKLGLLTCWDLFRLTRAFLRNRWAPDNVIPLFYNTGRILPIPTHYEYVGKVMQVWKNAFSVVVEEAALRRGDIICLEFPVDIDEQKVDTLQINDSDVESATIGMEVGVRRDASSNRVKEGFRVYRIRST